jgi:hypothetical protein
MEHPVHKHTISKIYFKTSLFMLATTGGLAAGLFYYLYTDATKVLKKQTTETSTQHAAEKENESII